MTILKSPINKWPAGTPVNVVDTPRPDMLVPTYDIILPDGTVSWAYDYELEFSCQPSLSIPTKTE